MLRHRMRREIRGRVLPHLLMGRHPRRDREGGLPMFQCPRLIPYCLLLICTGSLLPPAETAQTLQIDEPPLILAVRGGDAARVHTLLMQGANVNVRGRQGGTPLLEAAARNRFDLIALLLRYGALDRA